MVKRKKIINSVLFGILGLTTIILINKLYGLIFGLIIGLGTPSYIWWKEIFAFISPIMKKLMENNESDTNQKMKHTIGGVQVRDNNKIKNITYIVNGANKKRKTKKNLKRI